MKRGNVKKFGENSAYNLFMAASIVTCLVFFYIASDDRQRMVREKSTVQKIQPIYSGQLNDCKVSELFSIRFIRRLLFRVWDFKGFK